MMQTSLQRAPSTMNLGRIGFLCGNASAAKAKVVCLRCVETLFVRGTLHYMCQYISETRHVSTYVWEKKSIHGFIISKRIPEGFWRKKGQYIPERYLLYQSFFFIIISELFCYHFVIIKKAL
jgi:hypothetical protein